MASPPQPTFPGDDPKRMWLTRGHTIRHPLCADHPAGQIGKTPAATTQGEKNDYNNKDRDNVYYVLVCTPT